MIKINKGKEPAAWSAKKSTPDFIEFESIPELKVALLAEQGGICAYCMRRIPVKDLNENATSKVEHIRSQEEHEELKLMYSNFALCCPGNINSEPHCDKKKGCRSVSFDLHTSFLEDSITYSSKDGTIKSNNENWNDEMNKLLNLNHGILKSNRKNALDGVIAAIQSGGWSFTYVKSMYKQWSQPGTDGNYKEFCGIVIQYLKKKIKQST